MKSLFCSCCLSLALLAGNVQGAAPNLYWDINGATTGAGGATPSGLWEGANWSTDSTGASATGNWVEGGFPRFAAGTDATGSYTVTANADHTIAGMLHQTASGTVTISGTGVLTIDPTGGPLQGFFGGSGGFIRINNKLTGTGGIICSSGQIYLDGNNDYSGGTTPGAGLINFNNNSSFGTGNLLISVSGGALICEGTAAINIPNNWTVSLATASLNCVGNTAGITYSGNIALGANTLNLGCGGNVANIDIFSGVISGSGNLGRSPAQNPAGIIKFTGANTYTGKSSFQSGITYVSSLNSVANPPQQSSSSLGVPSSVPNGTLSIGGTTVGGTLLYTGLGETTDRIIDLAGTTGGATIQNDGTGPLTFTSDLTASGVGAKTLTLQGANTGNNTIVGKIVDSSSATAFTKAGAGKWILSGANTYSGATLVSAGTLAQGAANVIPFGTGKGTFAVSSGATFDMSGFDCSVNGFGTSAGTIDNTSGSGSYTLTIGNNNGGGTHSGPIKNTSGTVSVTKTGTGAIVLSSSTSAYSGKTIVNGGTLTINNAETALGTPPASPVPDQLTLNNGTTFSLGSAANVTINANRGITISGSATINLTSKDLTVPGIITGSGSLTKSGGNILILSGANTFSGGVTLTGGTLTVNNNSALGTGPMTITPAAICTVAGKSGTTVLANPITVNAGGGQVIDFFATTGNALTLNGQISGSAAIFRGNGGGAGPLTINADNSTYSGTFTLQQGPLVLGHKNALGTGTFVVTPGSVAISLAANTPLTGANAVANTTTLNGILPVTTASDLQLSGVLSGTGGVTKGGSGKLILSGANTYSGATSVTNGTLLVNNTSGSGTGSGAVAVQTGGTLGGNGDIAGTVTVNSTGNLSPGSSIGTLTLDVPPVLNGTTIMELDRNGGSPLADKLVVSAGL